MKPPLKGEGDRRQTVEGFFVESSAWCKRFTELPLSQPAAASSPKGEPIIHKGGPDNKASPLGEGNRR